ncbi:cobyric acid synthase [Roseovarius sp. Pro17]|uniref:cobyric acid synthase n=1 Tax=Roseovarius sp. Pro17 TaxID=3108175 RepID=UPI002D790582|nr:cobyric acid synthase [Roseovarius sp. Pro17]
MARTIMIQGAGSNVGKSMLVAGLARACIRRGLNVAPFKPQNMSNNAAVTADGGEIGRAQALQARAAGRAPHTDMNPVLLKPESETGAQIIVQGRVMGSWQARAYPERKAELMRAVLDSFNRLSATADLVLVEGAGSPAEINLRRGDIANMGFAEAAGVPVVLVGDIDRGGVIAQIVGTQTVLAPQDAARIKAFAINKFRGDPRLFDDGLTAIEQRTGWPSLGVIPWFKDAWRLPAEDALDIVQRPGGAFKVAVPRLGRIANFDDLDPLSAEPGVTVQMIEPGRPLPGDANLMLIPGSKSTIADLAEFRANGWDIDLAAHVRRGGPVLGLCGGYQMLGRELSDPGGIEGSPRTVRGLGHLDITTVMQPQKRLSLTSGLHPASGAEVTGYEIHMGRTTGPDCARPWLQMAGHPEGAASADGLIRGSYVHGLLASDAFRAAYLTELGGASDLQFESGVDGALDALADHLEQHMNIDLLLSLAREPSL